MNMIRRYGIIFLLGCFAVAQSPSQSVYVHPSHEVYDFLKRMDGKRIITDYRDAVKPITRRDVAAYLIIIDQHSDQLTSVEKQQLEFFKQEFYVELKQLNYEKELPEERWHCTRTGAPPVHSTSISSAGIQRKQTQRTRIRRYGPTG